MDVSEPEKLTQSPDKDKEFSRDSYLSPAFFSHPEDCSGGQCLAIHAPVLKHEGAEWQSDSEVSRVFVLCTKEARTSAGLTAEF